LEKDVALRANGAAVLPHGWTKNAARSIKEERLISAQHQKIWRRGGFDHVQVHENQKKRGEVVPLRASLKD